MFENILDIGVRTESRGRDCFQVEKGKLDRIGRHLEGGAHGVDGLKILLLVPVASGGFWIRVQGHT
jgi:hypothetical protein